MTDEPALKFARERAAAVNIDRRRQCERGFFDSHSAIRALAVYAREVSDAVEEFHDSWGNGIGKEPFFVRFKKFILPKPKPDPLEKVGEMMGAQDAKLWAERVRAALAAQGIKLEGEE